MSYFPFMIEVGGHKALVVGAGQSAKDKIRDLTEFGALVTVVAPVISADVVKQGKNITIERRVYRPGETKGYEIVVAATDNPAVNKQVAHDAARFGAICSVAGDPLRGGFIFPEIIKRDTFSIAISTDGKEPVLSGKLKDSISEALPEKSDDIAALVKGTKEQAVTVENPGSKTRLADYSSVVASGNDNFKGEADETASEQLRMSVLDQSGSSDEETKAQDAETVSFDLAADAAGLGSNLPDAAGLGSGLTDAADEAQDSVLQENEVLRIAAVDTRIDQVQADQVVSMLKARGIDCEKVTVRNEEIERKLISGDIDLAVRQANDMPVILDDSLEAAACLPREDARDILITRKGQDKNEIEVIGSNSIRRKHQIVKFLRNGEVRSISGSINDQLESLKNGEYDAIILTSCEVRKLMLIMDKDLSFEFIEADKLLPAPGQGITVLEGRTEGKAHDAAVKLNDENTKKSLEAERAFMAAIGAEDNDQAAAYSFINSGKILMKVMKYVNGRCVYFAGAEDENEGEKLAEMLARKILNA